MRGGGWGHRLGAFVDPLLLQAVSTSAPRQALLLGPWQCLLCPSAWPRVLAQRVSGHAKKNSCGLL